MRISSTWKFLYFYHLYVYRFIFKCSNKLWGQEDFFTFFVNDFDFSAELDKPIEFERYKACDVCFVCASQNT